MIDTCNFNRYNSCHRCGKTSRRNSIKFMILYIVFIKKHHYTIKKSPKMKTQEVTIATILVSTITTINYSRLQTLGLAERPNI